MSKSSGAVVSNKREKILEAAVKVFSSKGFHEAKVEEIARLADVGKGTVYEYFSSKTQLFQEMFKAGLEFYYNSIAEELKATGSAKKKLTQAAKLHLRFIIEYRELAKITMSEHTCFEQEFREWLAKMREDKLETIKGIIQSGIERGEFRKDVDTGAASMVFSGIMGALFAPAVMGNVAPEALEATLEQMLDVLLKGIGA